MKIGKVFAAGPAWECYLLPWNPRDCGNDMEWPNGLKVFWIVATSVSDWYERDFGLMMGQAM
jgi:hypothetical protein